MICIWCFIVGATVTVHQFFCILHFCHTCSLCRVQLVVQFPARGKTQVLLCLLPGVLWLWHFLYSVGPHTVSSRHIYTFVLSRAFMADAASQAGDADSFRAPGLNSGLQGSMNVPRGALLLVSHWQCISSFVFYIVQVSFDYVYRRIIISRHFQVHVGDNNNPFYWEDAIMQRAAKLHKLQT